jgi:hypothetical protein
MHARSSNFFSLDHFDRRPQVQRQDLKASKPWRCAKSVCGPLWSLESERLWSISILRCAEARALSYSTRRPSFSMCLWLRSTRLQDNMQALWLNERGTQGQAVEDTQSPYVPLCSPSWAGNFLGSWSAVHSKFSAPKLYCADLAVLQVRQCEGPTSVVQVSVHYLFYLWFSLYMMVGHCQS